MDKEKDMLDAGLRSLDHCELSLSLALARSKKSTFGPFALRRAFSELYLIGLSP